MKLIADSSGWLTAAKLFRPNTVFDVTRQSDGSMRIVKAVKNNVLPAEGETQSRRHRFNPERIEIIQPRVARHELPWEIGKQNSSTLKGLNQTAN